MVEISFNLEDEISGNVAPLEDISDGMKILGFLENLESHGFGPFGKLTDDSGIWVDGNVHLWTARLQKQTLAEIGVRNGCRVRVFAHTGCGGSAFLSFVPPSVEFFVGAQYSSANYYLEVSSEMYILDLLRKLEDEGFRPFNKQGIAIGVKVGEQTYKGDELNSMQVQHLVGAGGKLFNITILETLTFVS